MKKFIAILLVSLMALSMIPMFSSAEEAKEIQLVSWNEHSWENWSNNTQLLLCPRIDGKNIEGMENLEYTWEITISDGTTSKTIKAHPSSNYGSIILRFETCTFKGDNKFVPVAGTAYSISVKVYDGTTLLYYTAEATNDNGGFTCPEDLVPIVPEETDEPVTVKVAPKYGKIENYSTPMQTFFITDLGTPNSVYAQLKNGELFLKVAITDAAGKTYTISKYAWDSHKAEYYSAGGFMRLLPAAYGIPLEKDGAYTVAIEVYDAEGTVLYQGTSEKGAFASTQEAFLTNGPCAWVDAEGNTEITHYYDEFGPEKVTVQPHFGCVENWSGGTYIITGVHTGSAAEDKAILTAVKEGSLNVKFVITDTTDGKTYTISKYAFDTPTKEFYITDGLSFFRIAPSDYRIPMTLGHAYTVAVEISDESGVLYEGTSDAGAFNAFNADFQTNGQIIPEEIPHSYDEYEEPPVEAGEATAIIAVLAVVALFGTAVIVKKVHD